jgi:hypothetical protein
MSLALALHGGSGWWTGEKRASITPALSLILALREVGAQVAQLVEHVTENHGVGGSIPPLGTRTFVPSRYPQSVRGSVPVCAPHVRAMMRHETPQGIAV